MADARPATAPSQRKSSWPWQNLSLTMRICGERGSGLWRLEHMTSSPEGTPVSMRLTSRSGSTRVGWKGAIGRAISAAPPLQLQLPAKQSLRGALVAPAAQMSRRLLSIHHGSSTHPRPSIYIRFVHLASCARRVVAACVAAQRRRSALPRRIRRHRGCGQSCRRPRYRQLSPRCPCVSGVSRRFQAPLPLHSDRYHPGPASNRLLPPQCCCRRQPVQYQCEAAVACWEASAGRIGPLGPSSEGRHSASTQQTMPRAWRKQQHSYSRSGYFGRRRVGVRRRGAERARETETRESRAIPAVRRSPAPPPHALARV